MILALTSILAALSASQQAGDERARLQQLEGRLGLQKKAPVGPYAARLIWSLKQHGIIPTMMATAWLRDALKNRPLGQFKPRVFQSPNSGLSSDGKAIEAVLLDPKHSGRHPSLEAHLEGSRYFKGPPERTQIGQWRPLFNYDDIGVLAPAIPWAAAHFARWLKGVEEDPAKSKALRVLSHKEIRFANRHQIGAPGYAIEAALRKCYNVGPWNSDIGPFLDWMHSADGSKVWTMDLQDAFTAAKDWHDELARLRADGAAPPGVVIASWPDGYTLHRLVTQQQLEAEGETMGHCVGGYWSKVRDDGHVILSLRDAKGKSVATLDIKGTWEALAGGGTGSPIALGEDGHIYDLEGPENEPVEAIGDQLKVLGVLKDVGVDVDEHRDKLECLPLIVAREDLNDLREASRRYGQHEEELQTMRDLDEMARSVKESIREGRSAVGGQSSDPKMTDEEILEDIKPDLEALYLDFEAADIPDHEALFTDVEAGDIGFLSIHLDDPDLDLGDVEDWIGDVQSSIGGNTELIKEQFSLKHVIEAISAFVKKIGGSAHYRRSRLNIDLPNETHGYVEIYQDTLIFWKLDNRMRWSRLGDYTPDPDEGIMLLDGLAFDDDPRFQIDPPNWAGTENDSQEVDNLTTPDLPNFLNFAADLGLDLDRNARQALRRFNQ